MRDAAPSWTLVPGGEPAPDGPGTYVLVVDLPAATTIEFGAAGAVDLDAGWYAYVGSAFGPGGLSRVDRHRELAAGDRDARHWHVDYLLGHDDTTIDAALVAAGAGVECETANALTDVATMLPLGASDCGCVGHLVHEPSKQTLVGAAEPVLKA